MIGMGNFDKQIVLILILLCVPIQEILADGGLPNPPAVTMEDFNSQKMFYNPGEDTWEMADYQKSLKRIHEFELIIGAIGLGGVLPEIGPVFAAISGILGFIEDVTQERNTIFWAAIMGEIDKRILIQSMSDMNAKIQAFQSTLVHLNEEDESFAVAGFRQIEEILARFSETSSIFRKYPLHVSPLVIGFFPVMAVYVEYVAKKFPTKEQDWRSILTNKGLWVLQVYKKLSIQKRVEAVQSSYLVFDTDSYYPDYTRGYDLSKIYPMSDFLEISHNSELGDFPQTVRCRRADPSMGCRWKENHPALKFHVTYSVECIIDKFSGQTVLVESAFDRRVWIYYARETTWDEERRKNCLIDYIKVIEYLYGRMFWGVGSLMI